MKACCTHGCNHVVLGVGSINLNSHVVYWREHAEMGEKWECTLTGACAMRSTLLGQLKCIDISSTLLRRFNCIEKGCSNGPQCKCAATRTWAQYAKEVPRQWACSKSIYWWGACSSNAYWWGTGYSSNASIQEGLKGAHKKQSTQWLREGSMQQSDVSTMEQGVPSQPIIWQALFGRVGGDTLGRQVGWPSILFICLGACPQKTRDFRCLANNAKAYPLWYIMLWWDGCVVCTSMNILPAC